MKLRNLITFTLAVAILGATFGPQVIAQKSGVRKKKSSKAQPAKPFTLERVESALQDIKRGDYTQPALIRQVLKDGVAFGSTPQNCDRIKAAGGSDELVEAVRKLAPAPIPEPVAVATPLPMGDLEVVCMPVECEVSVDDQPTRKTSGGRLTIASLPEKEVSLRLNKDGFIESESRVRISSERTSVVRTELKPTRATRESWGDQLRSKALDALGGETGSTSMQEIFAVGECTVWGSDGKPYSSSVQMLLRPSSKAFFRARAGKAGFYEADYLPNFKSRTNFPEEQARALDAGFRLLNNYQLPGLMKRMHLPVMTLVADGALTEKLGGSVFRAESSTDTFTVSLDEDGRPGEILQDTSVGKGIRADYSEYHLEKSSYVPTRMSIVWPSSPQQGISIHFTSFELNPSKALDSGNAVKRRHFWQ